jgi:hypothetical protein
LCDHSVNLQIVRVPIRQRFHAYGSWPTG